MPSSPSFFFRSLPLLGGLMLAPLAGAAGQAGAPSIYTDMCVQAANMPAPHGESDLKGNPKLRPYCACFDKQFTARAMKAAQMGGVNTKSLAETQKEELAMRNSCRKEFGLPPAPAKPGAGK